MYILAEEEKGVNIGIPVTANANRNIATLSGTVLPGESEIETGR